VGIEQRIANEVMIMNTNLKVLLSAVAVAAVVGSPAAPAVAKSRAQLHYFAPDVVQRITPDIRDYVTHERLSTDPDPRIRSQLRRDGSSSWETE
jgi:hypothetical protein